jgi:hypothetical protein
MLRPLQGFRDEPFWLGYTLRGPTNIGVKGYESCS